MNKNTQIPEHIRTYLEGILQEAGMRMLDDQMKDDMIKELYFQLDNYLAGVIVDHLQPDDLDKFVKMNEEGKPREEIEMFIKEKIPSADALFTKSFLEFKRMYLEGVSTSKGK